MADKYIDLSYRDEPKSIAAPKGITATITGITAANPAVVTAANDFSDGDKVLISGVAGMTEINNLGGTVASASATSFAITEINSTTFTAYTSGGTASKVMTTTGNLRLILDDTVETGILVDAIQRAKEKVIELGVAGI